MKNSNYFIKHELLGTLIIKDIFGYYDIPRIFSCINEVNTTYIFYEIEDDNEFCKWVVISISCQQYYKLLSNQICLRDAFQRKESENYLIISRWFAENRVEINYKEKISFDLLPPDNFYVGNKIIDNHTVDTHQIAEQTQKKGIPFMDIVLYQNNHHVEDIDAQHLVNITESHRAFQSALLRKRQISQRIQLFSGGSIILRFNYSNLSDIFSNANNSEAFGKLHEALSQNDVGEIFSIFDGNISILNKYKNFIKAINDANHDDDINIISAIPDSIKPNISHLKKSFLLSLQKSMDEVEKTIEEVSIKGVLAAFSRLKGTFSFEPIDDGKNAIVGKITQAMRNPTVIYHVNAQYEATIIRTIFTNKYDKTCSKPVSVLKKLVEMPVNNLN